MPWFVIVVALGLVVLGIAWVIYYALSPADRPRYVKLPYSAASMRALALLMTQLTEQQLRELSATNSFTVRSQFKRKYRITTLGAYGVYRLWFGRRISGWCAYPPNVPVYDKMLAQKLLLESNERQFRKKAFRQWGPELGSRHR